MKYINLVVYGNFNMNQRIFILLITFLLSSQVYSQKATIKGRLIDNETKEPLMYGIVLIEGTTQGTTTDLDGYYILENVPIGTLTLKASYVSYHPIVKQGVVVSEGETISIDFALSSNTVGLGEVKVTGQKNRESETLLLMEQKKAVIATQAIGAQELSRKGVSDAEGAVTKVSGISKQEGIKNVFVRGLGDRYNITTLNGFVLPSEDPEYRNISLDFFSNDMIQSVAVSKVFSSSMNGDIGGALIDIRSKELVGDSEFEIGISSSLNSETIGKDILQPEGMNLLGFSTASFGPYEKYTTDYSFNTSLDPVKVNSPYNYGLSFSGGKRFLGKHRFFVAGAMSNKYRYEEGELREITTTGAADPFVDMTYTRYNRSSSNLLLGNLELNFNKVKLSYNSLYIHSATAYHADMFGRHTERFQIAPDFSGYTRRQQMNDNSIFINQIIVEGDISERLKYNVGAAANNIIGKEPDRRFFRFPNKIIGGDTVTLHPAENVNERLNTEIKELTFNPKFNIQYKLTDDSENSSLIEIGYDGRLSNKSFGAPIYNHKWNPRKRDFLPEFSKNNIELDKHINQDALSNDYFKIEHFNDTYSVKRWIHAAYVDFVYQINNSITLNPGLRLDDVYLIIDYDVNRGSSTGSNTLDEFKLSPFLNAKYEINDKNHLRIGASQTYTVPQDREISPFVNYGFDGPIGGNPNLKVSTNYNLDIKWDYYISNSELLTINGFYKYLLDPIARVDVGNSAGVKTYHNVSDHAVAAGIELELRKKLWSQANKHNISLGLNASYIYSKMELDPATFVQNKSSALEGAAPYILNSDLTYRLVSDGFTMNSAFVVNYLSDKIHTIGSMGYNNLIEESITTIDFVNTFKLKKNIGISLKALNLLNPAYKQTRKGVGNTGIPDVVTRSYKKGIALDLSINYKF
jgi:outer membrane receptor protein involved in Fe transport